MTSSLKESYIFNETMAQTSSNGAGPSTGFDSLPRGVWEAIFYQVPHGDLMINASRVCKSWRDTIGDESFMTYKKLYHAYKKGSGKQHDRAQIRLEKMMREEDNFMDSTHLCFLGFIKKIGRIIPMNASGSAPLIQRVIEQVPDFELVENLFKEQVALSDCGDSSGPKPLYALAALLVLAPDVETTSSLLRRLLSSEDIPLCLTMEIFYAAATFFLFFHRRLKIPDKHHYFVFAAIYTFESKVQVNESTLTQLFDRHQLSKPQRENLLFSDRFKRMTSEQYSIVNHDVHDDDVVKINAFAGTGKTTTLIAYTEVRPQQRFLYLAYNKSIQTDAEARFPRNVTCKTIMSVTWRTCGQPYSQRGNLGNLPNWKVLEVLGNIKGINSYVRAEYALKTLGNFIASADHAILLDHVPLSYKVTKLFEPDQRHQLLADANILWSKMKDYEDEVKMTFDGYLKLFQLRQNVDLAGALNAEPYDAILVDEAQDMTPATIDIIQRQNTAKILVGDPNQQIYSFRGAVNAMDLIYGATIYYLTKSFRFGPQIAHLCDSLLSSMKNVNDRTIIGNSNSSTVNGQVNGQICVITRTNSKQFSEVVKALGSSGFWVGDSLRPKIAFAGDDKKIDYFNKLLDIQRLYSGKKELIRDPYISRFHSFNELVHRSEKSGDQEILGKCHTVNDFKDNVPRHIENIRRHTSSQATADIVFSTAHKSKGLEFDTVKVTDDFLVSTDPLRSKDDEKNLLYVAVSRAKKSLIMNETLVDLLSTFGEPFVTLQPNHARVNVPLVPSDILPTAHRCVIQQGPNHQNLIPCFCPATLENSWIPVRSALSTKLPYEETTYHNTVEKGSFCRAHGFMVLPCSIPFLKTPCNLPAIPSEAGDAGDATNAIDEDVDYDRIMINPLNMAFKQAQ